MPASTGDSVCSTLRPILPRPSARSVPRCRSLWPIWLRVCVIFTRATLALVLLLADGAALRLLRRALIGDLARSLRLRARTGVRLDGRLYLYDVGGGRSLLIWRELDLHGRRTRRGRFSGRDGLGLLDDDRRRDDSRSFLALPLPLDRREREHLVELLSAEPRDVRRTAQPLPRA